MPKMSQADRDALVDLHVGDRVRTVGKMSSLLLNKVGTIQEITRKGWVWVVLDEVPSTGPNGAWAFQPKELEKLPT